MPKTAEQAEARGKAFPLYKSEREISNFLKNILTFKKVSLPPLRGAFPSEVANKPSDNRGEHRLRPFLIVRRGRGTHQHPQAKKADGAETEQRHAQEE